MGSDSIVSERTLREIYLKGFEIAITESQPMSIMTSYNLINGVHAANNEDTCTKAARCEWGFQGMIMTDWTTTEQGEDCTASGCMRAGNDLVMPGAFSDRDNLSANLTGENGVDCIYDAKTFMCIRDSLDIVKRIISLTVNFPRARGVLQVKYEADNYQFLTLHILEGKYYSEEEFQQIWGLYKEYERKRSGSAMYENPAAVDTKAM